MREFDRVLLAKRLSRDENYSTDAHVPQRSLPAATMGLTTECANGYRADDNPLWHPQPR
jgi:hypothetical protein